MNNITTTAQVKSLARNDEVKKRFDEVLGKKSNQFIASIVNAVASNNSLQGCEPKSIISSALVAASLDLPIDQNLGFSALVPYKCKDGKRAQFQMMAKGFIQLAIRSGQYKSMNYSEVYEDELYKYNPITKEVVFTEEFKKDGQRAKGQKDKIVGYYAWFKLTTGYEQALYMTKEEIDAHAQKYSASYRYDVKNKKNSSIWSTDFDVMAKKTVIKLLLSKWGILSVDIQKALAEDQKIHSDESPEYEDNIQDAVINEPPPDPFKDRKAKEQAEIDSKISKDEDKPLSPEEIKKVWE